MVAGFENIPRTYGFPPLLCEEPSILILGTLPGGESLTYKQYYFSNSNRIWKVLCFLTGEDIPTEYARRKALLAKYHIVLWDYYESGIRPNSSKDNDIRDGHPNDIPAFLAEHPTIKTIAVNGFGQFKMYGRRLKKQLSSIPAFADIRILRLPGTSGSNTNYGWGYMENLAREWAQIFD